MLFSYFAKRTDAYLKKIKGATVTERAIAFAKLRDNEGYICDLSLEGEYGFSLVEYHNPLEKIGAQYPSVVRMEETLFSRVLQVPVRRSEERASVLARYVFRIDATPDMPEATSEESEEEGSASGTPASRAAVVGHVQLVG